MELTFVDINEELESVLAIMEKDMQIDNVRVMRKFGTDMPTIKIDANRMRQVFMNLTNNARHAMEKRGGLLTVSTELYTKEVKQNRRKTDADSPPDEVSVVQRNFIRIKFNDTGTGVKEEDMVKLFDPFFTTKPEDKGTGLGLSVCHTIIEKHSGSIEVESKYGVGTTFKIDLPCTASRRTADSSDASDMTSRHSEQSLN